MTSTEANKMVLYYLPGACSLAPHIALEAAGLPHKASRVTMGETRTTEEGEDFYKINPAGSVPALKLPTGDVLTEGAAILQYIADQAPDAKLAPANGTLERARVQEALSFISTELHKNFAGLFFPINAEHTAASVKALEKKFALVNDKLEGREYLVGDSFTIADGYLFTVKQWADMKGVNIADLKNVQAHAARVKALPFVRRTLEAEGLPVE